MLSRRFDEFADADVRQNGRAHVARGQQVFDFDVVHVQRVADDVIFVFVQHFFRIAHFCQRADFFADVVFGRVFGLD